MRQAFLIAAPHSGSGKTTVARGLMALLRRKGYKVQPFKCGPDYIDTKFHEAVCGRPSVNLDSFFASPEHLRELFNRYTEDADIAVVEGMMGLFDGYDRDRGSSAEIARVLDLPVLLVVDARSAAYSMAALLQGFTRFWPDLTYAGVLYNKVSSPRHAQMLRQVCNDLALPCLGCLPKRPELETASRYLGLDFSDTAADDGLVQLLEQHVDCERLISEASGLRYEKQSEARRAGQSTGRGKAPAISRDESNKSPERAAVYPPVSVAPSGLFPPTHEVSRGFTPACGLRPLQGQLYGASSIMGHPAPLPSTILVARNAEAFSFMYQETLDQLATLGPVEFFDPEGEIVNSWTGQAAKPSGKLSNCQILYLPGGYPEKHLEALAKAEDTRRAIRDFAERGGRIVAECGGMMYLCQSIVTDEGEYPMCGVLPYKISARKQDRRLSLGYRRFMMDGREFRGHEFHYTQVVGGTWDTPNPGIRLLPVTNAKGEPVATPVIRYKNVVASYTHIYNLADLLQL